MSNKKFRLEAELAFFLFTVTKTNRQQMCKRVVPKRRPALNGEAEGKVRMLADAKCELTKVGPRDERLGQVGLAGLPGPRRRRCFAEHFFHQMVVGQADWIGSPVGTMSGSPFCSLSTKVRF